MPFAKWPDHHIWISRFERTENPDNITLQCTSYLFWPFETGFSLSHRHFHPDSITNGVSWIPKIPFPALLMLFSSSECHKFSFTVNWPVNTKKVCTSFWPKIRSSFAHRMETVHVLTFAIFCATFKDTILSGCCQDEGKWRLSYWVLK